VESAERANATQANEEDAKVEQKYAPKQKKT
jgi:hypothetical protein